MFFDLSLQLGIVTKVSPAQEFVQDAQDDSEDPEFVQDEPNDSDDELSDETLDDIEDIAVKDVQDPNDNDDEQMMDDSFDEEEDDDEMWVAEEDTKGSPSLRFNPSY